MSRDSNGNMSLAAGNPVAANTVITPTWANNTMNDIATALTDSLSRSGAGKMLAPLGVVSGTISLPGLTFLDELNTGFYRAASNDIRLSIAGVDRIRATPTAITLTAATTTLSGNLAAVGGAFSGAVSGTTGTFSGAISGTTVTHTGLSSGIASWAGNVGGTVGVAMYESAGTAYINGAAKNTYGVTSNPVALAGTSTFLRVSGASTGVNITSTLGQLVAPDNTVVLAWNNTASYFYSSSGTALMYMDNIIRLPDLPNTTEALSSLLGSNALWRDSTTGILRVTAP